MINVTGYSGLQIIHQSRRTLVYTASRTRDGEKVILRQLRPEFTSPDLVSQFREEFELLRELNSKFVIRPIDLIDHNGSPILVMENTGGQSLESIIRKDTFSIAEVIAIGQQIANALADIHAKRVVHRDLNPANIIFDKESGSIKLIDFGIASVVSTSGQDTTDAAIAGTLPYLAPEQSGRLNRSVDYRADFYAMGITLYEMLAGQRPFTTTDHFELIYSHIAKTPEPPHELRQDIPRALSRIVMKLLAKMPEDRYQSAFAIQQDLTRCAAQIQESTDDAVVFDFEVALDDIAEQLNISEKLIARQAALQKLEDAYERVTHGGMETVVCLGDAGVGKTTLMKELEKHALASGALVTTGRHNPINTEIPYAAISAGFGNLVRQLLVRPDFNQLKKEISESLAGYERSLLRIIPDLSLILNAIPDTEPDLPPSRKRLVDGLTAFITTIAKPDRPLLLFLDNLHWVDHASIELFEPLIIGQSLPYVMMVGAFRTPAESTATYETARRLVKQGDEIQIIRLENLDFVSVQTLISETFFRPAEEVTELTDVVFNKTNGNPLAVREFLQALSEAGAISFDREHREWAWHIETIQNAPPTENVRELLAARIEHLEANTSKLLQVASCIGSQFDLATAQRVSDLSYTETTATISRAIREGYLLKSTSDRGKEATTYQFAHERIQQAAYSLIKASERRKIHTRIGNALLQTSDTSPESHIFDVVNQLNNSFDSPDSQLIDRNKLAELNQLAGRRARQSAAFQAAFKYFRTAIALCGQNVWAKYDLSLEMHIEAAEAAYLRRP